MIDSRRQWQPAAIFHMILTAVLSLLFMVCAYWRTRRRLFLFADDDSLSLGNMGLDARVVESLPAFAYKAQIFKDALECAVCLSEFEENEKGRFLPNCKHSFHADCIDMWFRLQSTCPICRTGAQPKQRVGNNNSDEIFINLELISSGNREICIDPGLERGHTSSQEEKTKTAVDEGPSTAGISSMPETATDMLDRPESFSSEKQLCLHSGSQSSNTVVHSLKRMLSRDREGRVFPDYIEDRGIETEGQPES